MRFEIKWSDMPCRETILALIRLPTLSYLKLLFPSFFLLSDLALCVGLKSLDLHYVTVDPLASAKDIRLYQEKQPSLESFVGTYMCGNLLIQLCTARRADGKPIIDISGLKNLKMSLDMQNGYNPKELFMCCTQLRDVHLQYFGDSIIFPHIADLLVPSLQTLRQLHVEFGLDLETEPLNLLVSDLQSIAGRNSIERIKITCVPQSYKLPMLGEEWSALDKVFSLPHSGWESLKFLSLSFILGYADGLLDEFEQVLWKLPKRRLRGLVKTQDFQFDFDVKYEGL